LFAAIEMLAGNNNFFFKKKAPLPSEASPPKLKLPKNSN